MNLSKLNNNIINKKILSWYESNKKIKDIEDVKIIIDYINNNDKVILEFNIIEIKFSSDITFNIINLPNINISNKVRLENIFKMNLYLIYKKMIKYFSVKNSGIIIELFFEEASNIDKNIKKLNGTYKHDAYIKIYQDEKYYTENGLEYNDEEYFDIGLEYFEKLHNKIIDDDKITSSNVILDKFMIYRENIDNYVEFMKEVIYNIILLICSCNNDIYTLSKINFFKNFDDNKLLKQYTGIFNYIMNCRKDNKFNINDLIDKLKLVDKNGELYEIEDYIKYIKHKFNNLSIEFIEDEYIGEYLLLEKIIIYTNEEQSDQIEIYKNIYTNSIKIFFHSHEEIIKLVKHKNKITKKDLPNYISKLLSVHLFNLKFYTREKIIEKAKQDESKKTLKILKK